jgi:D-arabinose 1-dehydrogenase-like Zn-dependent alcohol dehydrogenase
VRGSTVGTRKDLEGLLMFAGEGKIKAHCSTDKLDNITAGSTPCRKNRGADTHADVAGPGRATFRF